MTTENAKDAPLPKAWWRAAIEPVALALGAAVLVWLRPPAPASEADAAVLVALRTGEPSGHTPPLWWLVGRAVSVLTGDAFAGLHLAVVAGWAALVWAVWKLGVRRGGGTRSALMGALAVAAWPTLLWRAGTVGPELPGMGLAAAAAHLFLGAREGRGGLVPAAVAGVAAGGVWAPALWLVVPLAVWAGRSAWRTGRATPALLTLGGAAAALALVWGGWLRAGGDAAGSWAGDGDGWALAAGSPWLGLAALGLAVLGGVAAWRRGRRDVLAVAAAVLLAGLAALATSPAALLLAVPPLALLWGELCGGGLRCSRVAAAAAALWAVAAVAWAWPALETRREPAPAWAALDWVRTHLDAGEEPVVYDPELGAAVRLVLAPAGLRLFAAGTPEAQAAIEAGQGLVWVGLRAHPGARVLKAWRWPSGRVQRLVRRVDASRVVSRLERTDPVRVSRGWRRVNGAFELGETGVVALEDGTAARVVKLKLATGRLRLRRAGFPALELSSESPLFSFVLVPGPVGALTCEPVGGPARFAVAELAPLAGGGSRALIVPQAAAVTGIGGSYWQTDLVLANPHPAPLTAEVAFLPSDRSNLAARRIRLEVPGSSSRLVENILGVSDFRQGPRTGALLVRTVGCAPGACGLEVLSRTYNIQGEVCDPVAEGLPGLPPERGLRPGATAVFEGVDNDATQRGYVGFASWGGSPVLVHAVLIDSSGRALGQLEERLAAWSHRHLRLPASARGATLKVTVKGGSETLVFPYLSTVASGHNCSTHRYPDRVEGPTGEGVEPKDPAVEEGARSHG